MLRIETTAPPALDKKHLDLKKATQQFEDRKSTRLNSSHW